MFFVLLEVYFVGTFYALPHIFFFQNVKVKIAGLRIMLLEVYVVGTFYAHILK